MDKPAEIKKLLEEMISSQDFDQLKPFLEENRWLELTIEERELLALLSVMQGEKQLLEGSHRALESFKKANTILPENPKLLYRQALAFALQHHNMYCLRASCKIFEEVLRIEPNFFDAWYGWGNVLVMLGALFSEGAALQEALGKFQHAVLLSEHVKLERLANFYRDWGVCWYYLGRASGEPLEFCSSIKMFRCAEAYGLNKSEFWNDYGNSLVELSCLTCKHALLLEAVEIYWKAIRITPEYNEGWINLANTLLAVYQLHPHEAYFTLAAESFDQAVKFEPQNPALWLKWGKLCLLRGKFAKDLEKIQESCKKFEIADSYEPNHSTILRAWGEALTILGSWTENFYTLQSAREKIQRGLEIQPDHPLNWSLSGRCLLELGIYFQDEKLIHQAIEKFQHALKLDPKDYTIWHEEGLAYLSLSKFSEEVKWLEESAACLTKAAEFGAVSFPPFWNDWGVAFMKLSQVTDEKQHILAAINKFEQAIRLATASNPEERVDIECLYNYGCALDFLGDHENDAQYYEKAIQVLHRVLEVEPTYALAHYNLGTAYSHLGEQVNDLDCYYEACRHFEIYLNQCDSEDDHAWCEWGITLLNITQLVKDPVRLTYTQKLYVEAESKFLYALALGNTFALYHLGCLFSLMGNYVAAVHYLEQAKSHNVLPGIDELVHDEWLEGLRQTKAFQNFLSHIRRNEKT
jgi:tetratricopeptide (TPR) repeat protein